MRYVGGKARIASWVVDHLMRVKRDTTKYLEPFVGAGAVLVKIAPNFAEVVAADAHKDLILLWQAIQSGWDPPRHITKEEYDQLRHAEPSARRGVVGFGSSFGGKWFGGYVDTPWDAHHKRYTKPYLNAAVESLISARTHVKHVTFVHADCQHWRPDTKTLVYCDPPYKGTLGYASTSFDSDTFWRVATDWAMSGAVVVVSESDAPSGWIPFAERTRKAMLRVAVGQENTTRREALWVMEGVR